MWSIGIANAFEVSIPSLGLDEKRFAVAAAAAAASSKGLSNKKLDKGTNMISAGDKKTAGGMKVPSPFSIAQLKEIGASIAKNCGRLVLLLLLLLLLVAVVVIVL